MQPPRIQRLPASLPDDPVDRLPPDVTAVVPEDRYRAPAPMDPGSFDVSDGGFNI